MPGDIKEPDSKQEFPMRLQIHLGNKIIALKTLTIDKCEFEDDEILEWVLENEMEYDISINRDKNQVEIRFADCDENGHSANEALFIMRWIEGVAPE